MVLALLAVGGLLLAPRQLAAIRLLGVSLAWWAAVLAHLGIGALALGATAGRRPSLPS